MVALITNDVLRTLAVVNFTVTDAPYSQTRIIPMP